MASGCSETPMDFVVVATCHSEFVGKIFMESDCALHVICIDNNSEIEDDVILTFT